MLGKRIARPLSADPSAPGSPFLVVALLAIQPVLVAQLIVGHPRLWLQQDVAGLGQQHKALGCLLIVRMLIGVTGKRGPAICPTDLLGSCLW